MIYTILMNFCEDAPYGGLWIVIYQKRDELILSKSESISMPGTEHIKGYFDSE